MIEGLDPEFSKKARAGDLIVAGKNFGWNRATGVEFQATALPPFMRDLMAAGGLVPYTRRRLEIEWEALGRRHLPGASNDAWRPRAPKGP